MTLEVKGFDRPVAAYQVQRALPRLDKVRGIEGLRAELIGRDEEFAKASDALEEVLNGRGQIVTLIGEAGVGKSRLVAELKKKAVEGACPPVWLEGRCLELGMTASYFAFIDLFREHFAWKLEDNEKARAESIATELQRMVERGDLAADRCEEIGAVFGNLFSIRLGTEQDRVLEHADPEQIKHRTFMATRDFFLAQAKGKPVVLVLEDLHWADSLSLDLVSLLMEALSLAPLLLLCVYRPEQEHKCWHLSTVASRKCSERFTEIRLSELNARQSRKLVESLLTIDKLPESMKKLIIEKSQGNPFFVEEVVRSLIDAGVVYQEEGTWRAGESIESVDVPESIRSVVLGRVDRLEEELKRVLQSASVIGRIFRRRVLGRVIGDEGELEQELWALEDRALIYQERANSGGGVLLQARAHAGDGVQEHPQVPT